LCPYAESCDFFNSKLKAMPSMAELYKLNYCKGNHESCARKVLFMAFGKSKPLMPAREKEEVLRVLTGIFPNQSDVCARVMQDYKLMPA
jgi:hypothetical protein